MYLKVQGILTCIYQCTFNTKRKDIFSLKLHYGKSQRVSTVSALAADLQLSGLKKLGWGAGPQSQLFRIGELQFCSLFSVYTALLSILGINYPQLLFTNNPSWCNCSKCSAIQNTLRHIENVYHFKNIPFLFNRSEVRSSSSWMRRHRPLECSPSMQKVECTNPGRDRLKQIKQVVKVPLPNARQQV